MFLAVLEKHPFLGAVGSAGSGLLALIQVLTPVLSFITILFGLVIGYLTLRIKLIEFKKNKNNDTKT